MRRGTAAGTLVALLGLTLVGCADPEPNPTPAATPASSSSAAANSSPATSDAPTPAPSTAPAPTSTAALTPGSPVTLAFGGDVHFEGRLTNLLTTDGLAALQPVLGAADVAVVNFETAITDRGVEQPKIYHFRTTPEALVTLQHAGVDAVSMATTMRSTTGRTGSRTRWRHRRRAPSR